MVNRMAHILLLDSDESHASALVRAIERHGHEVQVLHNWTKVGIALDRSLSNCDVIVLDLSTNRVDDWALLRAIGVWITTHIPRPQVLCLSRVHREPTFRLEVEKYGARFLHER